MGDFFKLTNKRKQEPMTGLFLYLTLADNDCISTVSVCMRMKGVVRRGWMISIKNRAIRFPELDG
jgi:hypothetical protein